MRAIAQYFPMELFFFFFFFFVLYRVVLNFEYVDEILKCDHSDESSSFLECCSVANFPLQV